MEVQFLGIGYCTEQNTDGIPSFVHCSLLRNGNHTLHQRVGMVRPNLGLPRPPSGCALAFQVLYRYFTVVCVLLGVCVCIQRDFY